MRCCMLEIKSRQVRSRAVSLIPVLLQPWEYNLPERFQVGELGVGCGSMNDQ
jgi:hypothetical protein